MTFNRDGNRVNLGTFEKFVLGLVTLLGGTGVIGTVGMWRELGELTQRVSAVERGLERLEAPATGRRLGGSP